MFSGCQACVTAKLPKLRYWNEFWLNQTEHCCSVLLLWLASHHWKTIFGLITTNSFRFCKIDFIVWLHGTIWTDATSLVRLYHCYWYYDICILTVTNDGGFTTSCSSFNFSPLNFMLIDHLSVRFCKIKLFFSCAFSPMCPDFSRKSLCLMFFGLNENLSQISCKPFLNLKISAWVRISVMSSWLVVTAYYWSLLLVLNPRTDVFCVTGW